MSDDAPAVSNTLDNIAPFKFDGGPQYDVQSAEDFNFQAETHPLTALQSVDVAAHRDVMSTQPFAEIEDLAKIDQGRRPLGQATMQAGKAQVPQTQAYESNQQVIARGDRPYANEDEYRKGPWNVPSVAYDNRMTENRARSIFEYQEEKAFQERQLALSDHPYLDTAAGMLATMGATAPVAFLPTVGPLMRAAAVMRWGKVADPAIAAAIAGTEDVGVRTALLQQYGRIGVGPTVMASASDAALNMALQTGLGMSEQNAIGNEVHWDDVINQAAIGGALGVVGHGMEILRAIREMPQLNDLDRVAKARALLDDQMGQLARGETLRLSNDQLFHIQAMSEDARNALHADTVEAVSRLQDRLKQEDVHPRDVMAEVRAMQRAMPDNPYVQAFGKGLERELGIRSVEDVRAELEQTLGPQRAHDLIASRNLSLVQSVEDLPWGADNKLHPTDVRGMVQDGRAYLVADNLEHGEAKGVLLHEVGVHQGMANLLDSSTHTRLLRDVATSDAPEVQAARQAVEAAGTPDYLKPEETLAYLVQNTPDAPLAQRVVSGLRQALYRATGGQGLKLTAQDIRSMAVAALKHLDPERARIAAQQVYSRAPGLEKAMSAASLESAFKRASGQVFKNQRDFKLAIQQDVAAAAEKAGVDLTAFNDQVREHVAQTGLNDALYALKENANAIGWYDRTVKRAMSVLATIHPEIASDPKAAFAFKWALAVTSNGMKVDKNFRLAEQAYRTYKETGTMPSNIGIGTAANDINKGLALFNKLVDLYGAQTAEQFMGWQFRVSQLKKMGLKAEGENAGTVTRGALVLGPKIGNGFFSNLYGRFDALTIDRWLMRTWGRWTGKLVDQDPVKLDRLSGALRETIAKIPADERARLEGLLKMPLDRPEKQLAIAINKTSQKADKRAELSKTEFGDQLRLAGNNLAKAIDGQIEMPQNGSQREFIRKTMADVLDGMHQAGHTDMTMADLQALLWYPEKRLYEGATSKSDVAEEGYTDDEAPDYANAAVGLARDLGIKDDDIAGALARADATALDGAAGARPGEAAAGQDAAAGAAAANDAGQPADTRSRFLKLFVLERDRLDRADHAGSRAYGSSSPQGAGRSRVLKVWKPDPKFAKVAEASEVSAPVMHELKPEAVDDFHAAITEAKKANAAGAAVYVYPKDEYRGMRLFLAEDGKSGFAIKADGDIVSVFNTAKGGRAHAMLSLATQEGGDKLDCFRTVLPNIYNTNGFKEYAHIPWNDEYKPDDWDYEAFKDFNGGRPDVVYMKYEPRWTADERVEKARTAVFSRGAATRTVDRDLVAGQLARLRTFIERGGAARAPVLDDAEKALAKWRSEAPVISAAEAVEQGRKNQRDFANRIDSVSRETGVAGKVGPVKTLERLSAKMIDKADSYAHAGYVTDIIRGGFIVDSPSGAKAVIDRLREHFPAGVIDEGWAMTPAGYFDRKVLVKMPDGQIGEVQLWEPNLLRAKDNGGHQLYDKWRKLDKSDPQRSALSAQMQETYSRALEEAGPEWKAEVGKGGSGPNLDRKASGDSTLADMPTSEPDTSFQEPLTSAQASPSRYTAGRLSQLQSWKELNDLLTNTSTPDMGRGRDQIKAILNGEPVPEPRDPAYERAKDQALTPDSPEAEARALKVNPETGESPELLMADQLDQEGQLGEGEKATLEETKELFERAGAFANALQAAMACVMV